MRLPTLFALIALACPCVANATVLFDGRGATFVSGSIEGQWSNDFGNHPSGTGFPPNPGFLAGVTWADTLITNLTDGGYGGMCRMQLAPSGPATLAAPICTYFMNSWSTRNGTGNPRSVGTYDPINLHLEPPSLGVPVFYAIRWHAIRNGIPANTSWSIDRTGHLADENSPSDGVYYGTLQGLQYSEYIVRITLSTHAVMSYTDLGTSDVSVTFEVFASETPIVGAEQGPSPEGFALSSPRPNPVRERTTLAFTTPEAGAARVQVLDVTGRAVRVIEPGVLAAGRHELHWDRRDSGGSPVRAGIYLARVEFTHGGRTESRARRLVVLD